MDKMANFMLSIFTTIKNVSISPIWDFTMDFSGCLLFGHNLTGTVCYSLNW